MNVLDLGIDYGTIVTINFQSTINKTGNGFEQRLANWDEPLLSFEIGQRTLNNQELFSLQGFFDITQGSNNVFLFKDWSDYFVNQQILTIFQGNDYQLYKEYFVETYSIKRTITKPKANSLKVYIDDVEQVSGWSINEETGILSFLASPLGVVKVDFEFYVPVRFVEDKIDYRFNVIEAKTREKIYTLEKLSLIEVRDYGEISFINFDSGNYDFILNIGYDYETVGGESYNTSIYPLVSGFERRRKNWENSQGQWDVGQRKLLLSELSYLISCFRICRGQFGQFYYQDWKSNKNQLARFGEDSISFRFDAMTKDRSEAIFDLSGTLIKKVFQFETTYIIPLVDSSGSMSSEVPDIQQALSDVRQTLLEKQIYASETELDKYFKPAINYSNERYLAAVAQDYRDNSSEESRYRFLIFQNEADSVYHDSPRVPANEPTTDWLTDYYSLDSVLSGYSSFQVLIIVPNKNITSNIAFLEHIIDAINGIGNYTLKALSNKNFAVSSLNAPASSQSYYQIIVTYFGF